MNQLVLQRTKEAFDHRIVIAIALATHAGHEPVLRQLPLVGQTRVRGALVRVMDQPRSWSSVGECHLQRRQGDVLIRFATHRPANHAARVQVQEHRQLRPACPCRNGGQIARLDAIGRRRAEDLVQAVGSWWRELMRFAHEPESAHPLSHQAMLASQPRHAMTPTGHARGHKGPPQLERSIPLFHLPMEGGHPCHQASVGPSPRTEWTVAPGVVAAPTDGQDLTESPNPMLVLMRLNELVLHDDSRA